MVSLDYKIKDTTVEEKIVDSEVCFVEFGAKWCSYCTRMRPIVEKLSRVRKDIEFIEVDIDEAPLAAAKYRIMSIPTFIIFKNGEPCFRRTGILRSEELEEAIDKVVKED